METINTLLARAGLPEVLATKEAVSYTHLDVYKRQCATRPQRPLRIW